MNGDVTVLRSVAWRDEPVRVRPLESSRRPEPSPPLDPARLGYEEGLRRGLEQGRAQGLEAGRQEGHAAGLAKGLADGRVKAQEELRLELADLRHRADQQEAHVAGLAAALEGAVASAGAAAEDELVVVCMEALCRIVGPAVVTPEGVRAQVARLLADHDLASAVSIHLHPADADLLDGVAPAGNPANLRWVADDAVALGGCIVQGPTQAVDARLEAVFEAFKSALLEGRARHRDARLSRLSPGAVA